jgi:Na+/melibiose symporter-like transporter
MRAWHLAAYGALGAPLAMAALPVYVLAPAYYSRDLGLALPLAGGVMFASRLLDAALDPFMGAWIDRVRTRQQLPQLLFAAALLMMVAFAALWQPQGRGVVLAAWLGVSLILVYCAHSVLNIAYLAWGTRLSGETKTIAAASAWREGAGLAGVLLASALPTWLIENQHWRPQLAMWIYSVLFAGVLVAALLALLRLAPVWQGNASEAIAGFRHTLGNRGFRRLLLPYFLNAISVSIPSTLALIFISDRLKAETNAACFLIAYFLTGAIGLPFWTWLANRIGAAQAWRCGMLLAVAAFAWAGRLSIGDSSTYLLICMAAGFALGADLALPSVILASNVAAEQAMASYVGIWTLLGKLALATSALSLPLLAVLGYHPGIAGTGSGMLALAYAGLPCLFKLAAFATLDTRKPSGAII